MKNNPRACRIAHELIGELQDERSILTKITVVRVSRSSYRSKNGCFVSQTSVYPLKRKCIGYQLIDEDYDCIGAEVIDKIINLYEVQDGTYYLIDCNHKHDWETGVCDDWEYKLIPFKE